jgi:hypothetical protein
VRPGERRKLTTCRAVYANSDAISHCDRVWKKNSDSLAWREGAPQVGAAVIGVPGGIGDRARPLAGVAGTAAYNDCWMRVLQLWIQLRTGDHPRNAKYIYPTASAPRDICGYTVVPGCGYAADTATTMDTEIITAATGGPGLRRHLPDGHFRRCSGFHLIERNCRVRSTALRDAKCPQAPRREPPDAREPRCRNTAAGLSLFKSIPVECLNFCNGPSVSISSLRLRSACVGVGRAGRALKGRSCPSIVLQCTGRNQPRRISCAIPRIVAVGLDRRDLERVVDVPFREGSLSLCIPSWSPAAVRAWGSVLLISTAESADIVALTMYATS